MQLNLKSFLPKGLVGRAALILFMPVILVQLAVSFVFIDRHFSGVTSQMTRGVALELGLLRAEVEAAADPEAARAALARLAPPLGITATLVPDGAAGDRLSRWDWSGRNIPEVLREGLGPAVRSVDLVSDVWTANVLIETRHGLIAARVGRERLSANNPHQLLVVMGVATVFFTLIAAVFLRNQLVPITRLARAAEAFGKGQVLPYRLRGATEVRAAGQAFLDMRARIERQIEQRTLLLSGVSHDLRTPITRLKLGLSLLPEDAETRALQEDVGQMERLVEEFLAFARGDAMEEAAFADPAALARTAAGAAPGGVDLQLPDPPPGPARLREAAVLRALDNLLANAARFGKTRRLSLVTDRPGFLSYVVEDDGPGIPEAERDIALQPFQRLDAARDPNHGGGVGLGLAIAADVARSHGGALVLDQSPGLGGLRARLDIAV